MLLRALFILVIGCVLRPDAIAGPVQATLVGYGLDLGQPIGPRRYGQSPEAVSVGSDGFLVPFGMSYPGFYPVLYSGMASADGSSGVLRAAVSATQTGNAPWRFGEATALTDGVITLSGRSVDPLVVDVSWAVDGLLVGASSFDVSMFAVSLLDPTRVFSAGGRLQNDGYDSIEVDETYSFSITGVDGASFRLYQRLFVSAASVTGFASADFSRTSVVSFQPSSGVSVFGEGGYLATAQGMSPSVVSSPGTLLIAGLGLAMLLSFRPIHSRRPSV